MNRRLYAAAPPVHPEPCYASFYQSEHPANVFSPMTEYEELLEETFKKSKTFVDALKNNPKEATHYFALNANHNLQQIPKSFSSRGRQGPSSNNALLSQAVLGMLIC